MSRWTELFESHVFRTTWKSIKDSLLGAVIDDETDSNALKELARLNKVVAYLDALIQGLDPELVPSTIWDTFEGQASLCNQQIQLFNSNRDPGHIVNANNHADSLLSYIKPYMVSESSASKAVQKAFLAYSKIINEHGNSFTAKAKELLEEINAQSTGCKEITESVETSKKNIEEVEAYLFGKNDDPGVKNEIESLVEDFGVKNEALIGFYNETLIGDSEKLSTKQEILTVKERVNTEQQSIQELLKSAQEQIQSLDDFHTKIFGVLNEEEARQGGLKGELDTRIKELEAFEVEQKKKYKTLNEEIEGLLPGATSSGLASAYREVKESFDNPIRNANIIFYISVTILVVATLIMKIDTIGGETIITFVKYDKWDIVIKSLIYKLPLYLPVLWLAFYATKRRSEYQRLQQEYAHKESLAKSYNSFKMQIESLGDEDKTMQREFINKTIDAIAYNASVTLDGKHGDKMPSQEALERALEAAARNLPSP